MHKTCLNLIIKSLNRKIRLLFTDFSSESEFANLFKFTEEIFEEEPRFLCSE